MSDFESRVRDALRGAGDAAPAPDGLADGARRRARNRQRTALAAGAAAVAAAIAVPAGLALGGPEAAGPVTRDPSPPAVTTSGSPTEAAEPSAGGRVETWRNLEIRVPEEWGYGSLSAWCAAGGSLDDRVVERPGGVVEAIACKAPQSGFGAQFFDPAAYDPAYPAGHVRRIAEHGPFPQGSWVGFQYAGESATADAAVLVVAPSEAVAREVLDSVRMVDEVDDNGCRIRLGSGSVSTGEGVSVCRYGLDSWLEQSELLSPEDGAAALEALAAAPVRRNQEACPATPDRYPQVVFADDRNLGSVRVVWGSECPDGRGVFFSGVVRELTEDVMYWALSPGWSGGVDGSVPLPGELRR